MLFDVCFTVLTIFCLGFAAHFSVFFAINPIIQKFEHYILHISSRNKWLISLFFITFSGFLIGIDIDNSFLAYRSMTGLIILTFFLTLSSISLISQYFYSQDYSKFIMIKMACYYVRKDIILTTMMVMSIALACGLFISMSTFINSFQLAVSQWITTSTQSDIYIQAKNNTIPRPIPLSREDADNLMTHPATKSWKSISRDNIMIKNQPVILRSLSYKDLSKELLFVDFLANRNSNVLDDQDILVSESAAKKLNIRVGDTLTIPSPSEAYKGIVAGIHIDYASEHGVITISNHVMKSLYQDRYRIHGLSLMVDPAFRNLILGYSDELIIQSKEELQGYVIQMFKQTFGLTWILASISGIIAIFVLINMLSVMIIDRRYEINQMFAMGAQKHHLRSLIFSHAIWIGLLSLVMALFVGTCLSFIILKQLTPSYFGWNIPLILSMKPISTLIIVMVFVIVLCTYIAYRYIWRKVTDTSHTYESIKTLYFSR